MRRFALLSAIVLMGCASQPEPAGGGPGLLVGLFHGFTALLSLAGSLFLQVRIYAYPNAGFWYDAGFAIGFSGSVILIVMLSIARIGGFITQRH